MKLRLILLKGELGTYFFTGYFNHKAMVDIVRDFVSQCDGPNK